MQTPHILIVEDELVTRNTLKSIFEAEGYIVHEANDGAEMHNILSENDINLVIMDINLPGKNGLLLARELREQASVALMFLTGRDNEVDKILGLEIGADDYITKPFSPKELVARIKAVMRRISPMAVEEVIEMQGLSLDPSSHRVMANDQALDMGPTEFKLLHFFMTHPERVYSREQLLNHVWGTNVYVEDRTVDVHIRRLRKALETSGHDKMVQTVRGTGYRFSTRY